MPAGNRGFIREGVSYRWSEMINDHQNIPFKVTKRNNSKMLRSVHYRTEISSLFYILQFITLSKSICQSKVDTHLRTNRIAGKPTIQKSDR